MIDMLAKFLNLDQRGPVSPSVFESLILLQESNASKYEMKRSE